MNAERQTEYHPIWLIAGGLVAAAGASWMSVVLLRSGALQFLWAELGGTEGTSAAKGEPKQP